MKLSESLMPGSGRTGKRDQTGFTLIELLVGIAIIAILAAILFPVFAQAREKARQTACLSNMKQTGTAMMMYAQDYDEALPVWNIGLIGIPSALTGTGYWSMKLTPYVKNGNPEAGVHSGVWRCLGLGTKGEEEKGPSYGMSNHLVLENPGFLTPNNAQWGGSGTYLREIVLATVAAPANVVYAGESGNRFRLASPLAFQTATLTANYTRLVPSSPPTNPGNAWELPHRHNGGGNYIFVDGHAKWFKREAMYPAPANTATRKQAARITADFFEPTEFKQAEFRRLSQ